MGALYTKSLHFFDAPGVTPRKLGGGVRAHFSKPLPHLWPKSCHFSYLIYDLKKERLLKNIPNSRLRCGNHALFVIKTAANPTICDRTYIEDHGWQGTHWVYNPSIYICLRDMARFFFNIISHKLLYNNALSLISLSSSAFIPLAIRNSIINVAGKTRTGLELWHWLWNNTKVTQHSGVQQLEFIFVSCI